MKLKVLARLLAVLLGSPLLLDGAPSAASSAAPARILLSHSFQARAVSGGASGPAAGPATEPVAGGEPAPEPGADVAFVLEERRGEVRKGGAGGRELFDATDYSGVAQLIVYRDLLLGPSDPPITLPSGTYVCDLVPTGLGTLRLVLRGADGLRLSLPLLSAPSDASTGAPPPAPSRATAMAFEQPGNAWIVGLRLPTAEGAFVLTLAGESAPARTRTDVIRRELRDRLMHGSRPVRRVPR